MDNKSNYHSKENIPQINEMENAILKLYHENEWKEHKSKGRDNLKKMLRKRQEKLDASFVWTPESVQRIVLINRKMQDCLKQLRTEASRLKRNFNARLKRNNDSFLNDYEMEAQLTPFVYIIDKDGDYEENGGIFEVLCNQITHNRIYLIIGCKHGFLGDIYFSQKLNWIMSNSVFDNDYFKDIHIDYALYVLNEHCYWSAKDILSINEIWGELIVKHQHFVENI